MDISSVHSNRAASKKFFTQFMQPPRQEEPPMLHRSPSGAKRKIRQHFEERRTRPSPFQSNASPSSPSEENYRSLIDSGGYRSILPDLSAHYSSRMYSTSSLSSSMVALDVPLDSPPAAPVAPPVPAKPTVEVHPMPSEPRKMEKPAVPAKPKGLRLLEPPSNLGMGRSTSMSSLPSPLSTSSLFLNNLFSTPSFASLTKDPSMGSHELLDLESRRLDSMSTLTSRLARLREEHGTLEQEMATHESEVVPVWEMVEREDPALLSKVRRYVESRKELVGLEAKLRIQLDKVSRHLNTNFADQKSEAIMEENRLRKKLAETNVLRNIYDRKEREIEENLARILPDHHLHSWQVYKETMEKLAEEEKQILSRISDTNNQLRALQN